MRTRGRLAGDAEPAFWDKREGVWRVSENDPDSGLYAVSRDADTVIRYMAANS